MKTKQLGAHYIDWTYLLRHCYPIPSSKKNIDEKYSFWQSRQGLFSQILVFPEVSFSWTNLSWDFFPKIWSLKLLISVQMSSRDFFSDLRIQKKLNFFLFFDSTGMHSVAVRLNCLDLVFLTHFLGQKYYSFGLFQTLFPSIIMRINNNATDLRYNDILNTHILLQQTNIHWLLCQIYFVFALFCYSDGY